jgi:hypothetical protein
VHVKARSVLAAAVVSASIVSCTSRDTTNGTEATPPDSSRPAAVANEPGTAATTESARRREPTDVQSTETPKPAAAEKAPGDPRVNPDAALLVDFKERLDKYISLRKSADDHTPPLKKTDDPAEIKTAQESLGKRIRDLNINAKHGDVFTPEISALFRRLLHPEVTDKGTKEAIKDDNPGTVPYLKVNAPYPDKEPLSTVPPNVLMTLPRLPDDIEYRFVGKNMILRDVRANLIIDYIQNAIP